MIEHVINHRYRIRLHTNNTLEIFKYNQPYTDRDNLDKEIIIAMLLEIDRLKKKLNPSNIVNFPRDSA